MAKGLLKSGAKPARGGKREGSGRKPDWLKEKCKALVDRHKLLEYLANVAAGVETQTVVVKISQFQSETEEIPCDTKDRLHAVEMLLERGYGKPAMEVVHSGDVQGRFVLVCPEVRK